ncbi:SF0329 family protein [Desulfosporosinus hippei]|uniref:Uncharacterized protein n=1 Tax=Desulfosporosinus hippei DSM 8344 TaxID=1121419 RepID=A0A1G8CDX9_9FIRM|nr:hypothetical protein [Desulfosporosinus hippei]SDH43578.1 hypothetical protein SAMN05443529_11372 [Desulfosporosinus hippei DSM 8344]
MDQYVKRGWGLTIDWSKIKQLLESNICATLQGRISLNLTNYRSNNKREPESRFWISLDKKDIFSISKLKWLREWQEVRKELLADRDVNANLDVYDQAEEILKNRGFYYLDDVEKSLRDYLSTPFDDALQSRNMIIKGLTMIDRRLGKRRLISITLLPNEFDFVIKMYKIRCESEEIEPHEYAIDCV